MKNYAIAFMNYFDNELKIYFTKAKNEKEAILKTVEKDSKGEQIEYIPDDYNEIISYYINCDANICVIEIPNPDEIS